MSTEAEAQLRRRVLLTFQVALLGMVGPSLRGVTVAWGERRVVGRLVFDGAVGDEEEECASEIETEIMASFPNHEVEVSAQRHDHPAPLNERLLMGWVYRRKEA